MDSFSRNVKSTPRDDFSPMINECSVVYTSFGIVLVHENYTDNDYFVVFFFLYIYETNGWPKFFFFFVF